MNQVQEIIVYRNPGEKAMWDMLMSGEAFPIMMAVVVCVIVIASFDHVIGLRGRRMVDRLVGWRNAGYVSLAAGFMAAVATWWLLRI